MERDLVRQGDWLAKIDLKNAYFLISCILVTRSFCSSPGGQAFAISIAFYSDCYVSHEYSQRL